MDLFTNELQAEEVEIVETVRLGKKQVLDGEENKLRPILVKLTETHVKWNILKNAKKIKYTEKEEYKKVFIAPDLTLKERKINKELREQLQEKRNKGEKGWYIKNGQLVKGNFR